MIVRDGTMGMVKAQTSRGWTERRVVVVVKIGDHAVKIREATLILLHEAQTRRPIFS